MAYYAFDLSSELELAYAVTVHKSQGSEFEAIILPVMGGFDKLYYHCAQLSLARGAEHLYILQGRESVAGGKPPGAEIQNGLSRVRRLIIPQEEKVVVLPGQVRHLPADNGVRVGDNQALGRLPGGAERPASEPAESSCAGQD